mmetsp:Transcript_1369/g.4045  ORF Transcript_1369/g.4045 Transcript_1369/m.4045 type:complete len:241 (+) Transcript_1369:765-1487(+)
MTTASGRGCKSWARSSHSSYAGCSMAPLTPRRASLSGSISASRWTPVVESSISRSGTVGCGEFYTSSLRSTPMSVPLLSSLPTRSGRGGSASYLVCTRDGFSANCCCCCSGLVRRLDLAGATDAMGDSFRAKAEAGMMRLQMTASTTATAGIQQTTWRMKWSSPSESWLSCSCCLYCWIKMTATPLDSLSSRDSAPYTKAPDSTRAPIRSASMDTEVTMMVALPNPSSTAAAYTKPLVPL